MQDQVNVISMVPKFLRFFELAKDEADKEKRWELWKEHYGFAAVPPGEAGEAIAKELLEEAWEKYPSLIPDLKGWEPDVTPVKKSITAVKELFDYEGALDVNVIYYVGGFEGNAFVAPSADGKVSLCFPVETKVDEMFFAHEITHIVHAKKAELDFVFERSIATVIMQEGLATRASQFIVPGSEEERYIEDPLSPGWLEKCKEHHDVILDGIRPNLAKKDMDTLKKYIMDTGSSGVVNREVYYIGWVLVDYLLKQGETLESLASIREEDLVDFIDKTIEEYRLVTN